MVDSSDSSEFSAVSRKQYYEKYDETEDYIAGAKSDKVKNKQEVHEVPTVRKTRTHAWEKHQNYFDSDEAVLTYFESLKIHNELFISRDPQLKNKKLKPGTDRVLSNPDVSHHFWHFECKNGLKRKPLGKGKHKTHTKKLNCLAYLKFKLSDDGRNYKLDEINYHKSHHYLLQACVPVGKSKLSNENKQFIETHTSTGGKNCRILSELRKQGVNFGRREVANANYTIKKSISTDVSLIQEIFSEKDATYEIKTDENGALLGLFFCTPNMKRMSAGWPELLMIDSTFGMLDVAYPVVFAGIVDGNGATEIIGVAIIPHEDEETYSWSLESIFKHQPGFEKIRAFMSDKDFAMRKVFKEYPNAKSYICTIENSLDNFIQPASKETLVSVSSVMSKKKRQFNPSSDLVQRPGQKRLKLKQISSVPLGTNQNSLNNSIQLVSNEAHTSVSPALSNEIRKSNPSSDLGISQSPHKHTNGNSPNDLMQSASKKALISVSPVLSKKNRQLKTNISQSLLLTMTEKTEENQNVQSHHKSLTQDCSKSEFSSSAAIEKNHCSVMPNENIVFLQLKPASEESTLLFDDTPVSTPSRELANTSVCKSTLPIVNVEAIKEIDVPNENEQIFKNLLVPKLKSKKGRPKSKKGKVPGIVEQPNGSSAIIEKGVRSKGKKGKVTVKQLNSCSAVIDEKFADDNASSCYSKDTINKGIDHVKLSLNRREAESDMSPQTLPPLKTFGQSKLAIRANINLKWVVAPAFWQKFNLKSDKIRVGDIVKKFPCWCFDERVKIIQNKNYFEPAAFIKIETMIEKKNPMSNGYAMYVKKI
uniref:ZSWIM1/3 RNaseH-like domain-containing protein n=1 Tax=Trichogramma kaykai TaxID=54128 RepID=A0ABD2WD76_9HYME